MFMRWRPLLRLVDGIVRIWVSNHLIVLRNTKWQLRPSPISLGTHRSLTVLNPTQQSPPFLSYYIAVYYSH